MPRLTYSVPKGWGNLEDLPGNFLLLPPGANLPGVNAGTSDYVGVYSSVVAPGRCTTEANPKVPGTFDGLIGWLTSNPRLLVSNVHDVTVGGLKGTVMDIRIKPGKSDGCSDGEYVDIYVGRNPSDLYHSLIPDYLVRGYFLRRGKDTLVIEVADARKGSDYRDWPSTAADIIDSFRFAAN